MNRVFAALPALLLQLWGCQKLLRGQAPSGLLFCWAGWTTCGLLLPGPYPKLGSINFAAGFLMVALPLVSELRRGLGRRWLLLLGFLAFCGCLPFSTFSAYFQTFVPLMSVGEGVPDMHAKLFSAEGLLGSLAMLCVIYQAGSLGYFYWTRVLPAVDAPAPGQAWSAWWLRIGIACSAALGLQPTVYRRVLQRIAALLGVETTW